ncbi:hypothetical protein [Parapedobacter sp.]|nr:hypothetical protein [Parapedobacter sp.]
MGKWKLEELVGREWRYGFEKRHKKRQTFYGLTFFKVMLKQL